MAEKYISVFAAVQAKPEFFNENHENKDSALFAKGWNACNEEYIDNLLDIPPADVRPVKEGENITENNPVDEFVCSKCGIILEDWSRVEIDEDDGERTNHEYVFRFCPNCGADMTGGTP